MTVLITDGHLPYPYGRETTGYEVADLQTTLSIANEAGVTVIVEPYTSDGRVSAVVQFPGGYVAEIHAASSTQHASDSPRTRGFTVVPRVALIDGLGSAYERRFPHQSAL